MARLNEIGDDAAETDDPVERFHGVLQGIANMIDERADNEFEMRGLAKELRGDSGLALARKATQTDPAKRPRVHGVTA